MLLWCVIISLESCTMTCFDIAVNWIHMGMNWMGFGMNKCCQIAVFDFSGRRNRFPVGRNRVPSVNL